MDMYSLPRPHPVHPSHSQFYPPPRPEQRVYFLNPWACSEFKPTGSSKMGVNVLQVKMCGHIKITKKKHIAGAKTRDYFHHVISLQIILEKSWFA